MIASAKEIFCDTTSKPQLFFNISNGSLAPNSCLIVTCDHTGLITMYSRTAEQIPLWHITTICGNWKIWLTALLKRLVCLIKGIYDCPCKRKKSGV